MTKVPGIEIKIDEVMLQMALMDLNQVIQGTAYGKMSIDSFISKSLGSATEGLESLVKELQHAESQLIILFEKTKEALEKAGMKFQEADAQGVQNVISIGVSGVSFGGGNRF